MQTHWKRNNKGASIVEILVVAAIITASLAALLGLAAFSLKVSSAAREATEAKNIAEGIVEAVRSFRDATEWNNDDPANQYDGLGIVSVGVSYHPEKSTDSPPKWQLIQGEQTDGIFTSGIVFENVSRDPATDDIEQIYNPLNQDLNIKKATITVSWKTKSLQIVTYFTNWK